MDVFRLTTHSQTSRTQTNISAATETPPNQVRVTFRLLSVALDILSRYKGDPLSR